MLLDLLSRWQVRSDGNKELESLGIDIADVHPALVGEEDVVAVADGVDANVEFGVRGVGKKRLDDLVRLIQPRRWRRDKPRAYEGAESAGRALHLQGTYHFSRGISCSQESSTHSR